MNLKLSAAKLIVATAFVAAMGPIQAACYDYNRGWHMVSRYCDIRPAHTWQQYNSGIYTQPRTGRFTLPLIGP
jgi:hypothetical protein